MANIQLVVFELQKQYYGVEINYIHSIHKFKDFKLFKMPACPPYVEGMINLHGKVILLYHLGKRILNNHLPQQDHEIIIVSLNHVTVGFMVDEVFDIITLQEKDIQPTTNLFTGLDSKLIDSIGQTEDHTIMILNVENVLSLGK